MTFKINYTGDSSRGVIYDYKCSTCGEEHQEIHGMMEEPKIKCSVKKCKGICYKVILKAPSLDADHHDSMRSYNIGWDEQ